MKTTAELPVGGFQRGPCSQHDGVCQDKSPDLAQVRGCEDAIGDVLRAAESLVLSDEPSLADDQVRDNPNERDPSELPQ